MKIQSKTIAASFACALLLVGCATQQQTQTTSVKPAPAPALKSTPPSAGYGPHYTTYEANGAKFTRGSWPPFRVRGSKFRSFPSLKPLPLSAADIFAPPR